MSDTKYGQCKHGNNLAACWMCNPRGGPLEHVNVSDTKSPDPLRKQIAKIVDGEAIEHWERTDGRSGPAIRDRVDAALRKAAKIMALVQPAPDAAAHYCDRTCEESGHAQRPAVPSGNDWAAPVQDDGWYTCDCWRRDGECPKHPVQADALADAIDHFRNHGWVDVNGRVITHAGSLLERAAAALRLSSSQVPQQRIRADVGHILSMIDHGSIKVAREAAKDLYDRLSGSSQAPAPIPNWAPDEVSPWPLADIATSRRPARMRTR